MPVPPAVRLMASCTASPLDARRGIVRIHRDVLNAIGAKVWDPVVITGSRVTGALVAPSADSAPRDAVICDDLLLANAGVANGGVVAVQSAALEPARAVVLQGPPPIMSLIGAEALRMALLNKVVTPGDNTTLLPEELAAPTGTDPASLYAASQAIAQQVGREWASVPLMVVRADPPTPSLVTMSTVVGWEGGVATTTSGSPGAVPTQLPGLESQMRELGELLDVGFHGVAVLARLGAMPQMGVLVSGPPGSGKKALVHAVAAGVGARVVAAWGPKIAALQPTDAANSIKGLADEAAKSGPTVLFIEDVDALVPAGGGPLTSVVVEMVRSLIAAGRVAVVCSTAHPETLDPILRTPDTLDHQLGIAAPPKPVRLEILKILTRSTPLADDVKLDDVAARTPGFVAADLMALCREAALQAAHRSMADSTSPVVDAADLDAALERVRPSVLDDASLTHAGVTLDDVGDLADVKQVLQEVVLWPLTYPKAFERLGVSAPHGVLLYGPPGCGKTFVVSAFAQSGQANLICVKGAELLSKWVGESERGVRDLFRRAQDAAPSIVFLDEMDALAPTRGRAVDSDVTDRVVAALLTELDGVRQLHDVVVVGATNRPDLIDPAMLRPGRLERLVYLPPPDAAARTEILKTLARKTPFAPDVDLGALAAACDGFSAADLAALVREAALCAMRESMDSPDVTAAHLATARQHVHSSLDADQVAKLAGYAQSRS